RDRAVRPSLSLQQRSILRRSGHPLGDGGLGYLASAVAAHHQQDSCPERADASKNGAILSQGNSVSGVAFHLGQRHSSGGSRRTVLPEGADTLLQPQRGRSSHREVRTVSLGLERRGEHHERPLGYLETPGDSGQNPSGQRLHLRRQSEASAKHGASYPSL